jgi:hypothetical protein
VTYEWRSIWLFSAIVSVLVLLFFFFTFSEKENRGALADDDRSLNVPLDSSAVPQ